MTDDNNAYIAEYGAEYGAGEIHALLQNVPDIAVEEFLFVNSKLDLRYVVLTGNARAIQRLEERAEFVSVEVEGYGTELDWKRKP